ncbi:MAG: hypothetical protein M0Q43_07580 [Methanothrix sp.]|jgi:hypothetical protein|nr:hypothetical protein [Methanothrix sp.]
MKEVIASERGIWKDIRRAKDSTFWVEDDVVATWFHELAPGTVVEPKQSVPEPEMTYGQLGQKPVSLAEALTKKGPGRPKKEEGRKMDVIT